MSGEPDSSDDLIAELAKLMATNAKGEASAASTPAKPVPSPEGKPLIRIPGMDMPPLTVTPIDGPRPASAAPIPRAPAAESKPAEAKASEARPTAPAPRPAAPEPRPTSLASRPAVAPTIRIPGMDVPAGPPAPTAAPIPKADFGKPPSAPAPMGPAPQGAKPAEAKPAQPKPAAPVVNAFHPRPVEAKPAGAAGQGPQRFEPRIVGETHPAPAATPAAANTPAAGNTPAPVPPAAPVLKAEAAPAAPRPAAAEDKEPEAERDARSDEQPNRDEQQPANEPELDPIAALIAADLGELPIEPRRAPDPRPAPQPQARPAAQGGHPGPEAAKPVEAPRPAPRPIPVAAVAPKPTPVAPRPMAGSPVPSHQQRQGGATPIPLKPALTARQVQPESDAFFVAPVFGSGKGSQAPAARAPAAPAASQPAAARSNDPMDEIESLIGEAVRVEMGGERASAPAPQQRAPKPMPAPVAPQPRRAAIKQHEPEAVPQSAEAAILAAAAATGAEVGRIDGPAADEPVARRKQFRPARARGMSGGMRQYVGMAVAGTMLLAAGFGLYWVMGMGRGDPATAPVLTADATPVKTVPPATANPATQMRSPVLDQIQGVSTPPDQEALAAPATDADAVTAATDADSGESALFNRKVRTVTVRPDGTIVTSEDAVAGAEPLPVERPNVPAVPGADVEPSDLLTAATTPAEPAPAPIPAPDPIAAAIAQADGGAPSAVNALAPTSNQVAALTPAPATTAPALAEGATPTPPDVVAPTPLPRPGNRTAMNGSQRAAAQSNPVTAEIRGTQPSGGTAIGANGQAIDLLASAPAAATQPRRTTAGSAAAYVQLSSQRSEGDARASMQSISGRYGSLFQGSSPEIRRADLGAKGIYYRVMLPANSRSQANEICSRIKSSGGECFVP